MTLQPEILKRLKKLEPLPCKTRVFSWPVKGFEDGKYRPDCVEHYDEWARITGSWPSNWRWGTAAMFEEDAKRCEDTGAKICLHVSPKSPSGAHWQKTADEYADRWHIVDGLLDLKLVEVVYIDCEDHKYIPHDGTDLVTRENEVVHAFNVAIYRIAREFVGDSVQVRRYNHLDTQYWPGEDYGTIRVNADTDPHDPVDGGIGCSMYYPIDPNRDLRNLDLTIQEAKRHGINEGTAWVMAGCSRAEWLCPGVEVPYEHVAENIYAFPYDPQMSHQLGELFAHSFWREKYHNDDYRNAMIPPMDKIHSVVVFPGVFHPTMDTTAVHLVALLEGMSSKGYDLELAVIQAKAMV